LKAFAGEGRSWFSEEEEGMKKTNGYSMGFQGGGSKPSHTTKRRRSRMMAMLLA
jgi:hypothetical protein